MAHRRHLCQVIASATPQVLLGTSTRRQAPQSALDQFAMKGIDGFVDAADRHWALESYTEMATRSATSKAVASAYRSKLIDASQDLVVVSDAPDKGDL